MRRAVNILWHLAKDLSGRTERSVGEPRPDLSSTAPRDRFLDWAEKLDATARVIEIGTKQWVEGAETHLHDYFPGVPRANYLMVDIEAGNDVDVVADLHELPADWTGRFDALVAGAVFEHLERPWIAAKEVVRVLKPGGRCYIATHQTYPLHGFPSDFFRFSREALSLIFADAGLEIHEVAYEHRSQIIAPPILMSKAYARGWNRVWPSYLCVALYGEKPAGQASGA